MKKRISKEDLALWVFGILLTVFAFVLQVKSEVYAPKEEPEVKTEASNEFIEPIAGVTKALEYPVTVTSAIPKKSIGVFKVTAYCSCEKCCPGTSDGLTYTETVATEGRTIAVDPNVIPLGSEVEIGGKTYIAEDVGGAIKGNCIDIFFNSHEIALEFGVQYLDVFL